MIEQHEIRGHQIALQLVEVLPKRFRWFWRIDGLDLSKGCAALADLEVARSEALLYAQLAVERLERERESAAA